jgi:hypothetical protein
MLAHQWTIIIYLTAFTGQANIPLPPSQLQKLRQAPVPGGKQRAVAVEVLPNRPAAVVVQLKAVVVVAQLKEEVAALKSTANSHRQPNGMSFIHPHIKQNRLP